MSRQPIPSGTIFGSWTVLEGQGVVSSNVYLECKCICGKVLYIRKRSLLAGTSTSCGCSRRQKDSEIIGRRFSRLVVLRRDEDSRWVCLCDCGKETKSNIGELKRGSKKSCGCSQFDAITKHRLSHTPEYATWRNMMGRCHNAQDSAYKYYGAKGVEVCERWRGDDGVVNFIEDMGQIPHNKSLDRIDPEGNYDPLNCRWANSALQSHNRKGYGASKYKGVYIDKGGRVYSQIVYKGKKYWVGNFSSEKEAATAYNMKASELYGDVASLNKINED